jgi:hypothetical protein
VILPITHEDSYAHAVGNTTRIRFWVVELNLEKEE